MIKKILVNKLLLIIGILFLSIFPIFAFAQTQITISSAIPGTIPYANTSSSSPGAFIANFYQFAVIIAGVLAFGVIVYGGIRYMTSAGNPSGQSDAKEWIESALLGLLLIAGAYFILKVVNPQLLNLNLPGLSAATVATPVTTSSGGTTTGTGGSSGGGTCKAPTAGPCSVASLQNTCMGSNAASAAQICNAESSGNAVAGADISTNGQAVSIGLFQINLSANKIAGLNCPSAFDHTWHVSGICGKAAGSGCGPSTITNPSLYAQCVAAAQNINTNINYACSLSKGGTNWGAWSTSKTCHL